MMNSTLTGSGYNVSIPANDSGGNFFAITPSDATDFTGGPTKGIYVGVAGDLVAVRPDGTAVKFKNAIQGSVIPIVAKRVNTAGTTATDLVGLY